MGPLQLCVGHDSGFEAAIHALRMTFKDQESEAVLLVDHPAMAIHAISLQPLVQRLNDQRAKQVWLADDVSAGGKLDDLMQWWDRLSTEGPKFGYYPNPSKDSCQGRLL